MSCRKIGIDARLYSQTGVGTYLRNYLHYLSLLSPADMAFYIYALPEDIKNINLPAPQFVMRPVQARWHTLREQTVFYQALARDDIDLMHFTYFSYPVMYRKPFVATVHDITPLLFKTGRASTLNPFIYKCKHQVFRYVLSSQIKNARAIITPTRSVKDQIKQMFGSHIGAKIKPIYEGVSWELMNATENTSLKKEYPQPFFLYVGNFYPHKNVDRLVEAWQHISSAQLILVGPDNYFAQKLKKTIASKNIKNVRFNHKAAHEDLVFFYHHARALINPSLSEGFGLPLVEAAYFGCPVIASDIPVFKELLGNSYISFNPHRVEDMVKKLHTFPSVIPDLIRNPDMSKFSFEKMARETVAVYIN